MKLNFIFMIALLIMLIPIVGAVTPWYNTSFTVRYQLNFTETTGFNRSYEPVYLNMSVLNPICYLTNRSDMRIIRTSNNATIPYQFIENGNIAFIEPNITASSTGEYAYLYCNSTTAQSPNYGAELSYIFDGKCLKVNIGDNEGTSYGFCGGLGNFSGKDSINVSLASAFPGFKDGNIYLAYGSSPSCVLTENGSLFIRYVCTHTGRVIGYDFYAHNKLFKLNSNTTSPVLEFLFYQIGGGATILPNVNSGVKYGNTAGGITNKTGTTNCESGFYLGFGAWEMYQNALYSPAIFFNLTKLAESNSDANSLYSHRQNGADWYAGIGSVDAGCSVGGTSNINMTKLGGVSGRTFMGYASSNDALFNQSYTITQNPINAIYAQGENYSITNIFPPGQNRVNVPVNVTTNTTLNISWTNCTNGTGQIINFNVTLLTDAFSKVADIGFYNASILNASFNASYPLGGYRINVNCTDTNSLQSGNYSNIFQIVDYCHSQYSCTQSRCYPNNVLYCTQITDINCSRAFSGDNSTFNSNCSYQTPLTPILTNSALWVYENSSISVNWSVCESNSSNPIVSYWLSLFNVSNIFKQNIGNAYPARNYTFDTSLINITPNIPPNCTWPQSNTTINTSLYLHFDEGSGNISIDSSAYHRNGTNYNSPSWVAGEYNLAMQFNGVSQYVNFSNDAGTYERTQPFSIEFWMKSSYTPASSTTIIGKVDNVNYHGWYVFIPTDGTINIAMMNALSNYIHVKTNSGGYNNGNWIHVTITYDGSNSASGIRIYKNSINQTVQIVKDNLAGTINTTESLKIAKDNTASAFFNGILDEVAIYPQALNQSYITQRYNDFSYTCSDTGANASSRLGNYSFMLNCTDINGVTIQGQSPIFEVRNCYSSYICGVYSSCNYSVNISYCLQMNDTNCGRPYTGNMSAYNQYCTLPPVNPFSLSTFSIMTTSGQVLLFIFAFLWVALFIAGSIIRNFGLVVAAFGVGLILGMMLISSVFIAGLVITLINVSAMIMATLNYR
jgi:hypothetical protein